jgi:hypothetical protein
MVGRERRGSPVNGTSVRFAHRKTECGERCVPSELHLIEECPHTRSDILTESVPHTGGVTEVSGLYS